MNRRTALRALLSLPVAAHATHRAAAMQTRDSWQPLFNGRDLRGWETWLGRPHPSTDLPGLARNEKGEYLGPVGAGIDPHGVFSIAATEGGPAIRISGETYGALTTGREYGNYHLRFEFKWGGRKWPPREQALRDSGCCYHGVGPHGASYGYWLRSFEFQIQEGDCGDFYSLAGVIVDVEGIRTNPSDPKSDVVYTKNGPRISGQTRRIIRNPGNERPAGEWNTLELYCAGQTSAHVVNGRTNMVLTGLRHLVDGRETPLTRGRIQFQSEGAEVFYRNIELRPIREIPAAVMA